jgi:ubiquinone/menaquinone biosynthesis C-methylase UbiE
LHATHKTGIDISSVQLARARARLPDAVLIQESGEELSLSGSYDVIIVSDTLNYAADVEQLLSRLRTVATPRTRLVINFHNTLWRPLFRMASWFGLK